MSNGLHGDGAIKHCPDCRWCVNHRIYDTPPSIHSNIEKRHSPDCSISIKVQVARPDAVIRNGQFAQEFASIEIVVDSGATHSVFQGKTAQAKGLYIPAKEITNATSQGFRLLLKGTQPCCRWDLCVRLSGEYQPFEAYWPIEILEKVSSDGSTIQTKRLLNNVPSRGNLLGMKDILTKNMLCLTPEKLYVFPVLKGQQEDQTKKKEVKIPIETRDSKPDRKMRQSLRPIIE